MSLDFLCIGPPRSGTTWLYWMLSRHSQLLMPPIKELRYFSPKPWTQERKARRLEQLRTERHFDEWEQDWLRYWLTMGETEREYLDLFRMIPAKSGDITPSYCAAVNRAATVRDVVGDVPVFLFLRDPIARDWSQAKLTLGRQRKTDLTYDACVDFFRSDFGRTRGDYSRIITEWGNHFDLHFFFFDDIATAAPSILSGVTDALGLRGFTREEMDADIHPSKAPAGDMPEDVHNFLRDFRRGELEWLAERFGGHAAGWCQKHYATRPTTA